MSLSLANQPSYFVRYYNNNDVVQARVSYNALKSVTNLVLKMAVPPNSLLL